MINVLEYLERTTQLYPDKTAVSDGVVSYSFSELSERSRRAGTFLADICKARTPVPFMLEKGSETLAAFFGAVYAGCFYVLINPELPAARIEQIINVLGVDFVVTDEEHKDDAGSIEGVSRVYLTDSLFAREADDDKLSGIREGALDVDPLYANFTSGSTGVPKGVVVSHRSVIDFIGIFTRCFGITSSDVIGNQAPFDFDVSVKDIYSSLLTGAELVIVPKKLFSQPAALLDFICDNRVTVMIWAVSALCLISTFHGLDYKVPLTVKKILFSGEMMPLKHLKIWMEHLPDTMFVNLYGPTEITCNCTYHIVDPSEDLTDGIPAGRPFPNEHVSSLMTAITR